MKQFSRMHFLVYLFDENLLFCQDDTLRLKRLSILLAVFWIMY